MKIKCLWNWLRIFIFYVVHINVAEFEFTALHMCIYVCVYGIRIRPYDSEAHLNRFHMHLVPKIIITIIIWNQEFAGWLIAPFRMK